MKILFLSQWFDPEPTPKGLVFAKALQAAGHDVSVLTGFPNYPGGRLYPGYKLKWRKKEIIDEIKILRVWLYPNHNSSAFKRILNYLSFSFCACLQGIFMPGKFDIIYVYHPPITVGIAGAIISLLKRTPFILDVQDLWPDTLRAVNVLNPWLIRQVDKVCQWVYRRAAAITVLSPGFRRLLITRNVPETKIEVIYNWCNENNLTTKVFSANIATDFRVVFAGTMGLAQGLEAVIKAAKKIENIKSTIKFIFIGDGIALQELKQLATELHVGNIEFLPRIPMSEINQVLQSAQLLLVHLKKDALFEITIPSKTQAYMAAGKPLLMAVRGDAADLVTKAGAGICVEPENSEAIADAIIKISNLPAEQLQEMGMKASEFYLEHLSLNKGITKLLTLFEKTR